MKTLTNNYLGYKYQPPKIIYHYCSVEVLKNILYNKNIWLSDSYKTNDSSEMYWLLSNTRDIFRSTFKEYVIKYKPQLLEQVVFYLNIFDEIIESYKIPNITKVKKFITCFSEKGDLLSQWRAYGADGFGVSIGFDTKYLITFENSLSYEFSKIIYNKKKVTEFLKKLLIEKLEYIIMDYTINDSESSIFSLKTELCRLVASIYDEGFIYKDPHFSEEKEWRLMRKATVSNWNNGDGIDHYGFSSILEGFFVNNVNGNLTRSKLKFRTTRDDLIPYIELGFEKIYSKFIRTIILGPKCKIDKYDLLLLLNSQGYIETVYDENIRIIKSNIPYV